uniref:GH13387p n=1 Tax=Drosophila melanogaster TaxID=7227 RepID=Q95SN2_DROME|nr:GH13387p [Drosophila melanogaster]
MTKCLAGRLASNRCECLAAADHKEISCAAGDTSAQENHCQKGFGNNGKQ